MTDRASPPLRGAAVETEIERRWRLRKEAEERQRAAAADTIEEQREAVQAAIDRDPSNEDLHRALEALPKAGSRAPRKTPLRVGLPLASERGWMF